MVRKWDTRNLGMDQIGDLRYGRRDEGASATAYQFPSEKCATSHPSRADPPTQCSSFCKFVLLGPLIVTTRVVTVGRKSAYRTSRSAGYCFQWASVAQIRVVESLLEGGRCLYDRLRYSQSTILDRCRERNHFPRWW